MPPTLRRRPPSGPIPISSSSSTSYGDDDDENVEEVDLESAVSSSAEESDGSEWGSDDDEVGDDVEDEGEENEDRDEEFPMEGEGGEGADVYDRIISMLERGKGLGDLKLEECRVYLRKHNLRIGGTKAVCMQRIHEHWRIKDGDAEKLYPASSFTINCRGDVCKGDVILFKQRVYEKFDIVTRGANIIGKRTIAGRVVKESYGAGKQQHTFTVEILWSKGVKRLPALSPLLVKGRNLYRLKTFRQPWENESERLTVLSEKHRRGAAARHVRKHSKARSSSKVSKRKTSSSRVSAGKRPDKAPRTNMGQNRKVLGHRSKSSAVSPSRAAEFPDVHPSSAVPQAALHGHYSFNSNHYGQAASSYAHECQEGRSNTNYHYRGIEPPHHISHAPASQIHGQLHSSMSHSSRSTSYFTGLPFHDNQPRFVPMGSSHHVNASDFRHSAITTPVIRLGHGRYGGAHLCRSPGCPEFATHGCVVSSCWGCCRRIGMRCFRHQN